MKDDSKELVDTMNSHLASGRMGRTRYDAPKSTFTDEKTREAVTKILETNPDEFEVRAGIRKLENFANALMEGIRTVGNVVDQYHIKLKDDKASIDERVKKQHGQYIDMTKRQKERNEELYKEVNQLRDKLRQAHSDAATRWFEGNQKVVDLEAECGKLRRNLKRINITAAIFFFGTALATIARVLYLIN